MTARAARPRARATGPEPLALSPSEGRLQEVVDAETWEPRDRSLPRSLLPGDGFRFQEVSLPQVKVSGGAPAWPSWSPEIIREGRKEKREGTLGVVPLHGPLPSPLDGSLIPHALCTAPCPAP